MGNSEKHNEFNQDRLDLLQASFAAVLGQKDLFSNIIDFFPYGIEVFDKNGATVMINRAFLYEFEIPDKDMIIGKYNIFKDPDLERLGLMDMIREVFNGKTFTVTDVDVPLKSIRDYYQNGPAGVVAMFQDCTGFPIFNADGNVSHVVIMFITRRVYKGNVSMAKAVEYMESNWDKDFNLKETAAAAGLSPYHFTRVFKNDKGMTPYSYYIKYKLGRLMELLRDVNIPVKEAFDTCKME